MDYTTVPYCIQLNYTPINSLPETMNGIIGGLRILSLTSTKHDRKEWSYKFCYVIKKCKFPRETKDWKNTKTYIVRGLSIKTSKTFLRMKRSESNVLVSGLDPYNDGSTTMRDRDRSCRWNKMLERTQSGDTTGYVYERHRAWYGQHMSHINRLSH